MVLRAQQTIVGLKTPILGAVLTQVPSGSGEDYGYYTQAYTYYSKGPDSGGSERPGRRRGEGKADSKGESLNLK